MANTYGTVEARAELGAMSREMPELLRGFYGNPVNVDTLGGSIIGGIAAPTEAASMGALGAIGGIVYTLIRWVRAEDATASQPKPVEEPANSAGLGEARR